MSELRTAACALFELEEKDVEVIDWYNNSIHCSLEGEEKANQTLHDANIMDQQYILLGEQVCPCTARCTASSLPGREFPVYIYDNGPSLGLSVKLSFGDFCLKSPYAVCTEGWNVAKRGSGEVQHAARGGSGQCSIPHLWHGVPPDPALPPDSASGHPQ